MFYVLIWAILGYLIISIWQTSQKIGKIWGPIRWGFWLNSIQRVGILTVTSIPRVGILTELYSEDGDSDGELYSEGGDSDWTLFRGWGFWLNSIQRVVILTEHWRWWDSDNQVRWVGVLTELSRVGILTELQEKGGDSDSQLNEKCGDSDLTVWRGMGFWIKCVKIKGILT